MMRDDSERRVFIYSQTPILIVFCHVLEQFRSTKHLTSVLVNSTLHFRERNDLIQLML